MNVTKKVVSNALVSFTKGMRFARIEINRMARPATKPTVTKAVTQSEKQKVIDNFARTTFSVIERMRDETTGVPLDTKKADGLGTLFGKSRTRPTNIALGWISTIVALEKGELNSQDARAHIVKTLKALTKLPTYKGLFPEDILIRDGVLKPEVKDLRVRFSTLDSGWATYALKLIGKYYSNDTEITDLVNRLTKKANYRAFIDPATGLLINGNKESNRH